MLPRPMSVRDRLVPPLARALFALPPRVIAVLAGSPPPHAAALEPDAWLVARLAAYDAIPAGSLPPDELRAEFARPLAPPRVHPPAAAGGAARGVRAAARAARGPPAAAAGGARRHGRRGGRSADRPPVRAGRSA